MREAGDWAERKRDKNEDDRRSAMKVLRKKVLAAAALSAAMILFMLGPGATPAAAADDRDFVQAAAKSDAAALGKLLDTDFVWIDASGKKANREQVLGSVPKLII